ncbi:hypothetical protein Nmel_018315 [Mimus melanotis]
MDFALWVTPLLEI